MCDDAVHLHLYAGTSPPAIRLIQCCVAVYTPPPAVRSIQCCVTVYRMMCKDSTIHILMCAICVQVPFSRGCNLLTVYSKKHIDSEPELKQVSCVCVCVCVCVCCMRPLPRAQRKPLFPVLASISPSIPPRASPLSLPLALAPALLAHPGMPARTMTRTSTRTPTPPHAGQDGPQPEDDEDARHAVCQGRYMHVVRPLWRP